MLRRPGRRSHSVAGSLVLSAILPLSAVGEPCEPGPGGLAVGVEGGGIWYDVAGGLSGVEWGPDVAVGGARVAARLGYRQVELHDAGVTPQVVRGGFRLVLGSAFGMRVCATVHGGGSRFSADADEATVLAGGGGLGVSHATRVGGTPLFPFLEVRGLAAESSGTILDLTTDATGLSVGIEAGVLARIGKVRLRGAGSLDGFAAGLGVTPYPARALRLGADYRF